MEFYNINSNTSAGCMTDEVICDSCASDYCDSYDVCSDDDHCDWCDCDCDCDNDEDDD